MEREGEGRGRRGGGEMRRGIVIGGMILGLLMGCNNGIAELEKEKESILSISNLRQGFLDIFTTFGDLLKEPFGITKETTKQKVGEELDKVGKAVKEVKDKLEGIKGSENYNLIKEKADSVIDNAIGILKKIVDGTSEIREATKSASGQIANAAGSDANAEKADEASVKGLVKGISMISAAAKEAGIDSKGNDNRTIESSAKVGKLFDQHTSVSDGSELKAARIALTAASGADILAAIEAAKSGLGASPGVITAAKNAYEMAIANNTGGSSDITDPTLIKNASAISAGLALKAMAKGGKLATKTTHAPQEGVNAVLSRAVDKTVNEIVTIIRKTVDKCLKDVSGCIKEDSSNVVKSK